jgi:hypothetical protein
LPFVEQFFEKYPLGREQLLAAEDTAYFLAIAQRPGQKPVPFIPVLDASFEVWFKKVRSLSCDIAPCALITKIPFPLVIDRTLSGLPKISMRSLIKIRNASASFRGPLL